MEVRYDVTYKQNLIGRFEVLAGEPFLKELTAYLKEHRVPECWPVVIRWRKTKIKGWLFDNSMLLIEKIFKSADTPVLTVQVGE